MRNDDHDYGDPTPDRLVAVDPTTGAIRRTYQADMFGAPMAIDSSGRHLIYSRFDPATERSTLFRWSDGVSTKLTDQFTAAVW
jgi:hypothetical protein